LNDIATEPREVILETPPKMDVNSLHLFIIF